MMGGAQSRGERKCVWAESALLMIYSTDSGCGCVECVRLNRWSSRPLAVPRNVTLGMSIFGQEEACD